MEEREIAEPQPQSGETAEPQTEKGMGEELGIHEIKPPEPKKERGLRDKLAIERTKMAEERTQLSYIRTGISLLLGGIFFVGYFAHGTFFSYVGYATMLAAILFLAYGFYHHQKTINFINRVMEITFKEDNDF